MLDNVLDLTHWPLEKQKQEAMNKRRIGLGFTGLGDALIMMGLRYDTDAGRKFAAEIAEKLKVYAYTASVDLARERGAFPLFDAEKYLASAFVKRLPASLRKAIRKYGIRNSHLTSIAPTGTISLSFGNNVSGGVEPAFAWHYLREITQDDGTKKSVPVYDYAYLLYKEKGGDVDNLPEAFISATEIAAMDHLKMVEAIAPHIDSAISKTINVDMDTPYEEFTQLYVEAWKRGLKGITTFRPNPNRESVLKPIEGTPGMTQPADLDETDPDRRLRLDSVPELPLASLRFPQRPYDPNGNPSWTYTVKHPNGEKFALFVGHLTNGKDWPFEVWVNGGEQPRGLGALAIVLSHDMFSKDRGWLKHKLDLLSQYEARGERFEIPLPPTGEYREVPSLVGAMALLTRHRCEELGAFKDLTHTPVLDALMVKKEPRTCGHGTMSWTYDIHNPNTGDEFTMILKELTIKGEQKRPYGVMFTGKYPNAFDGLSLALSLDMRVLDPAWIGKKLRELLSYSEPHGEFMAWIPGEQKQRLWPSTVAYMARLMLHRYTLLGVLDKDGYPVNPMGVMEEETETVTPLRSVGAMATRPQKAQGKLCPECGTYSVVPYNGCDMCSHCGANGGCG